MATSAIFIYCVKYMTFLSVRIPTLWALATSEVPLEAWFCTYCILPLPWSFVARPLGPFPLASPTTISQISSSLTTLIFHPFNRKECVRISKGKWKIYNYRYLWCNRLKKNNFFLTAQPPQKEIKKIESLTWKCSSLSLSLQTLFNIYSVVYCIWVQGSLTQLLSIQRGVARTEPVLEEALLGCLRGLTRFE